MNTYGKAFHASPAAICISTLNEGRFVEVNESFCRLSGYVRDELLGKTSVELSMWDDPDERPKVVDLLAEKHSIPNYERRLVRKNREYRDCVGSVEVIDVGGEACLLVILLDITDRKRIHAQLRDRKSVV